VLSRTVLTFVSKIVWWRSVFTHEKTLAIIFIYFEQLISCSRVYKSSFRRKAASLQRFISPGQTRVDERWQAKVCMRRFSQPLYPGQTRTRVACMRVDEGWLHINTARGGKLSSTIKFWISSKLMRVDENRWELAVKRGRDRVGTLINIMYLNKNYEAYETSEKSNKRKYFVFVSK
jgi:hypothetical protein